MIRQLQDPKSEGHSQFKKATRQVARLPIDQLVGALNEHVSPKAPCRGALRAARATSFSLQQAGTCRQDLAVSRRVCLSTCSPAAYRAAQGERGIPHARLQDGAAPLRAGAGGGGVCAGGRELPESNVSRAQPAPTTSGQSPLLCLLCAHCPRCFIHRPRLPPDARALPRTNQARLTSPQQQAHLCPLYLPRPSCRA